MKFEIPPSISVGGVEYDIKLVDEPFSIGEHDEDTQQVGALFFLETEIWLWKGLSKEAMLWTLFHELSHLVDRSLVIIPGDSVIHSEELTDMVGSFWLQIFKQILEWNKMINASSAFDKDAERKEIKDYEVLADFSYGGGGLNGSMDR